MNSLYLIIPNKKFLLKSGISNAVNDIPNIPFCRGVYDPFIRKYMAISHLNRQWRHQKLEVELSREWKMILQYSFFWLLSLMLRNISLFQFVSGFNKMDSKVIMLQHKFWQVEFWYILFLAMHLLNILIVVLPYA